MKATKQAVIGVLAVCGPPSGVFGRASIPKHAAPHRVGNDTSPRMGAVEEPEVPRRERAWNERATASYREKTGVYGLLWVNASGMRQLRQLGLFAVRGAVTRRLLCVNVLKTQGAGICGGSTLRSVVRQGSALRSDERAQYARP